MKKRYFEVREGAGTGRKLPLKEGFVVGRALENDFVVSDRRASRRHAIIEERGDKLYIVDLKSANRTYVNGVPISEQVLENGDMVRIAGNLFIYTEEEIKESLAPSMTESRVFILPDQADKTMFQEARSLDENSLKNLSSHAKDPQSDRIISILTSLFEVSKKLSTIFDIDTLLEEFMTAIFKSLPNADRGFIMMPDPKSGRMTERVIRLRKGDVANISASRTVIDRAVIRKEAILSRNVADDEQLKHGQSIVTEGIQSVLCVPMIRSAEGKDEILGLIYLDSFSLVKPFDNIDLSILSTIAGQAAVAIKNAQLIKEIEVSTELRTSLQRYLSPDVVEQVIEKKLDIGLGGEIKEGTVLFADITDFTPMSERLDAATLVKMLNKYFTRMVEIVFSNAGTVDKFGGDSILSVWGAPKETPEAPFLAVKTALEMQNALFDLNTKENWSEFITIGIGLCSGKFLAGNIGSERRMEYTVIGHTVNLAQRVESLAASDAIMVNQETLTGIHRPAASVAFSPISVKGVSAALSVFSIVGYLDTPKPYRTVLSMPVTIVSESRRRMKGRMVGYFRDDFNRSFVSVMSDMSFEPDKHFAILPKLVETRDLRPIYVSLAEYDSALHMIGGHYKGRLLRIDTEKSDSTTLKFIACETQLTSPFDLSKLKEDEKRKVQS